jgi:hypothetical protein
MMRFTWIDCETGEKDENLFGANGQNDWEKGLGSALTYAERYFLLKYFHIPTDEDDIDNSSRKGVSKVPTQIDVNITDSRVLNCSNGGDLGMLYKVFTDEYGSHDSIPKDLMAQMSKRKIEVNGNS